MKKLNIGCGKDIKKGYVNLDCVKLPGVDVVHNLDKVPYPFKKNTFDEIYCSHVLEHVSDLPRTMKELHRILKKGGKLIIRVPHFTSAPAFIDPTHKRFFGIDTFNFFVKTHPANYYFDFGFSKMKGRIIFSKSHFQIWNYLIEPIANLYPTIYEWTILKSYPAFEIKVELTK